MSLTSVFALPLYYTTDYTDNVLSTIVNIATQNIASYLDDNNKPSNLQIGSTSNIIAEAQSSIVMYSSTGLSLYSTQLTSNNTRIDDNILNVNRSSDSNTTYITTGPNGSINHDVQFGFQSQASFNSVYIKSANNNASYDVIGTNKSSLVIANSTSFSSNVSIVGNLVTSGTMFGQNINIWNQKTNAIASTDLLKIGYGFNINSNDQLELIKMSYFNDASIVNKKVAIFGMNEIKYGASNDSPYLVFNALGSNAVSTFSNGNLISSASPLDSKIFLNGNNVGIGSSIANYKLDVSGTMRATDVIYANNGIKTAQPIIPATSLLVDIGSSSNNFRNIYSTTLTLGNNILMSSTSNALLVTDMNGNNISISSPLEKQIFIHNNYVGIGTTNAFYNLDVKGTGRYTDILLTNNGIVTGNNIIPGTTGTVSLGSSLFAFQNIYGNAINLGSNCIITSSSNALLVTDALGNQIGTILTTTGSSSNKTLSSTNVFSSNVTSSNVTSSNLTSSNANIQTLSVTQQILVPSSDYAEFIKKSVPSDVFYPGDIVGIDANGELTKLFADALHFMIISENPTIIGGYSFADNNSNVSYSDSVFTSLHEKIGFCGRLSVNMPTNSMNVVPGDYIVPIASSDGTIIASSVHQKDTTMSDFMMAVGHVVKVETKDGMSRPIVIIK